MLQPFELFRESYMERLIQLKKLYLVTQTYHRADGGIKNNLLLTDYEDMDLARAHLEDLNNDRYAAIIDLSKPEHKRTLLDMLEANSRYQVYWAVVRSEKELENKLNHYYEQHMRHYINRYTALEPARNAVVKPRLHVKHGELYVTIEYRGETVSVKFEEVENSRYVL